MILMAKEPTSNGASLQSVAVSISGKVPAADIQASMANLLKSGASAAVRLSGSIEAVMSALVRLKERSSKISATIFLRGDKKG
jgi:hypothetical protein